MDKVLLLSQGIFKLRYWKGRVLCILLYIASYCCFSQSLNFKNYSVDDGLPSSMVYSSFQDSRGYMWFATDLGVSIYDGYNFSNYTPSDGLSDSEVFNFLEDSSGRIWFLTLNGKISYYFKGKFYNSKTDSTLKPIDSESYFTSIFEDKRGNIWLSTLRSGLVLYTKEKQVRRFLEGSFIVRIMPNGENGLIVLGEGLHHFFFNNSLEKIEKHLIWNNIAVGEFSRPSRISENEVLFDYGGEIIKLNIYTGEHSRFDSTTHAKSKINNICSIDRELWVCSNYGAFLYADVSRTVSSIYLEKYQVSSVFKDREGNYWITTLSGGIFFSSFNNIYSYTSKEGLASNELTSLAKDNKGRIWVGYQAANAINSIHNGIIQSKVIAKGFFSNKIKVNKIRVYGDRIWLATSNGTFLLNGEGYDYLVNESKDILEYDGDQLWITASRGVLYLSLESYNKIKKQITALTAPLQFSNEYGVILHQSQITKTRSTHLFLDRNKDVWVSTESDALIIRKGLSPKPSLNFIPIGVRISDFEEMHDGTLLIATEGNGILVMKNRTLVSTITERNGLSSNICNSIEIDNEGILWVGTNEGINKVVGYPSDINIEHYDIYDGILSNEVVDVVVTNDTVWAATRKGLNFFNKRKLYGSTAPLLMYVENLSVNGKLISLERNNNLIFKYHENDIRISFMGLSYKSGGDILYRYKLRDDQSWSYAKGTSVDLPEMAPGEYQFQVSGKGKSGMWSKAATLHFVIEKPFWKTTFFLSIVVIMLGVAVWISTAIYFVQRRKESHQQYRIVMSELRTLRAQINPHFLFNTLNSIQGVLLKIDKETAQSYLTKLGKLMRLILDHSDRSNITIGEEIEALKNYLEIEQLRTDHQFEYIISADSAIDIYNTEIPAMIIQPFVENAIWHGFGHKKEKGHLLVKFNLEEDCILIEIKDDGVGRKRARELNNRTHTSKGMKLIKERIDVLNFQKKEKIVLLIEDLEDASGNNPGTCVRIKIPYAENE